MPRQTLSDVLAEKRKRVAFFDQKCEAVENLIDELEVDEQLTLLVRVQARVEKNYKASQGSVPAPRPKGTSKHATRSPSFTEQALNFVLAHPDGVKTIEVAKEIQQTLPSAHGTLSLLLRQKKIARHGRHLETLWTPPNVAPVKRIDTVGAAVMKVLEDAAGEPVDYLILQAETLKVMEKETGRTEFREDTITGEIYRLAKKNKIKKRGANEHGPMYVLASVEEGGQHEHGLKLVR